MSTAAEISAASKERFFVRLWSPPEGFDVFSTRITNVLIFKTFTPDDAGNAIFQIDPFKEDTIYVCRAQFVHGDNVFSLQQPVLHRVSADDLEAILLEMPLALLDANNWSMVMDDSRLIKKERLVPFTALALLEQALAAINVDNDKQLAYARWLTAEMLNKTNTRNWRTLYSIIG